MKKIVKLFVFILIIVGIGILFFYFSNQDKVKFNDGYVNGNTPGNLYNNGMFCESNGTIFFANPDDYYRLYSMNLEGGDLKKLSNDSVMSINADEHYVYYIRNEVDTAINYSYFGFHKNCLCRIPRNGGHMVVLDQDPCMYASLIGNYIYYLHYDSEDATTLYKIKIDGKEKKQIYKYYLFTCSADGQYFYYNDMQTDGSIWRFDTATDSTSLVFNCNSYKPIVDNNGNAYYLDVNRNNALAYANIFNASDSEILADDSIDLYNVYGSTIFYQTYDANNSALCMIKTDGSGAKTLMNGSYSCINTTSYNVYFTDYFTGQVYYTSISNPGQLIPFHPGVINDK